MLFIWQLWYFGPRLLNLEEWQGIRAHFALSQVMSFGYFGRSRKKTTSKANLDIFQSSTLCYYLYLCLLKQEQFWKSIATIKIKLLNPAWDALWVSMCWMIKACVYTLKLNSVTVMVDWLKRNVVGVVIVIIAFSSRYRESMRWLSFCDFIITCLEMQP